MISGNNMKGLALVMLLCAALLFGCAGQQPPTPAPGGNVSAPQNPPGNSPAQPALAPSQELLNALQSSPTWNAAYSLSSSQSPQNAGFIPLPKNTSVSQYVQARRNFRSDTRFPGLEVRVYALSDKAYHCVDSGKGWSCASRSQASINSSTLYLIYRMQDELSFVPAKYSVSSDGKMPVAGTSADCYRLTGSNATIRYCVSPEGIPLYMKHVSVINGTTSELVMSATQFGTSVADSTFKLPAEPKAR